VGEFESPFLDAIAHIIQLCPLKEVIPIETKRVVTVMAGIKTGL
jgi:hypothetical protein